MKVGGRKKSGFQKKKKGFDSRPNPQRKEGMSKIECFHCKIYDHFKTKSPKRFMIRIRDEINMLPRHNLMSSPRDPKLGDKEIFYYCTLARSFAYDNNKWLIDSGASSIL